MNQSRSFVIVSFILAFLVIPVQLIAWQAGDVANDPSIRMPGTQPDQLSFPLTGPEKDDNGGIGCLNCHGENQVVGNPPTTVTPGYPWMGSMMGQAARDPIFWATMTVAMQDAVWALGNANAGDLCLRCHFPEGWLGGRSGHNNPDDLNAGNMTESDYDGVHCDVCHMQYDPFFEDAVKGTRELGTEWDELPSINLPNQFNTVVEITYLEDRAKAGDIELFNGGLGGTPFYTDTGTLNLKPKYQTYAENGGGQFFISNTPGFQDFPGHSSKRGPFINGLIDGIADHEDLLYSRYHKSKYFCSTCHDVSNPVYENLGLVGAPLPDQSVGEDLKSEQYSANRFGHVERTFSEFMLSAYAQPGGAATNAEYAAGDNSTNIPGVAPVTHADKCQDCHMADVIDGIPAGRATPRPTPEHPNSGSPAHDFQGGNAWMTRILASLDYANGVGTIYDPINYELLTGGNGFADPPTGPTTNVSTHTLDVTQGVGLVSGDYKTGEALSNAADRAEYQLRIAATLKDVSYDSVTGNVVFKVQNNTGHKLISGYPEGRRMFINIIAYNEEDEVVYEINPYDEAAGTLKGVNYPYSDPDIPALPDPAPLLAGIEEYQDFLVYEMQQASALTEEAKTFHFVLGTSRKKDNRIPPKGFDIVGAAERLIEPVENGIIRPDYFTTEEYEGGYDEVNINVIPGADRVEVNLYYQGTSREYIEFLRDEINGSGNLTLYGPDNPNDTRATYASANGFNPDGDSAYLVQSDPFFAGLSGWGDTIWQLWKHNSGLGQQQPTTVAKGLTPFLMASTSVGGGPPPAGEGVVILPNGGETLVANNVFTVRWTPTPTALRHKLYYSLNNQVGWRKIAVVKGATSFDWLVPSVNREKTEAYFKIIATAKNQVVISEDVSDGNFTVIPAIAFLNPVAGDSFPFGAITTVSWRLNTTNPNVATIDLHFRKAPDKKWLAVATGLPNTATSIEWNVPTYPTKKRRAGLRLALRDADGNIVSQAVIKIKLLVSP